MRLNLTLLFLTLAAGPALAQEQLADQLRKAIVEEESNQNLDKAIQAYVAILRQFHDLRATAATALFHLAECYRKQGDNAKATTAYQGVVRDFPDQTKLAEASRKYLPKDVGAGQETRETEHTKQSQYEEARRRYRVLLEQEIKLVETQIQEMQRRVFIGTVSPVGPEMTGLKKELLELQRALAAFDAGAIPIPANVIK